ncbi:Dynein gamma chain, flagellar outer arm [Symbiodinium microadriaticum]|uniref:Dynein gamma chain, flagellar outer arm n=1 Tax=Symbiodinium microadriaticum TaxID=2951 RepID=A0A1Q9EA02_SYMMI|nr:Dynein gamma chain, flagellar outer arm [Symbiodinium microadriaticum]
MLMLPVTFAVSAQRPALSLEYNIRVKKRLPQAPDVLFCAKVSNVLLVNLPEEQELVTLEEFVEMQDTSFAVPVDPAGIWAYDFVVERHVRATTDFLAAKNVEIENAVNDMLGMIVGFELEDHVQPVTESHCGCSPEGFIAVDCLALRLPRDRCEIIKVKAHYNWSMLEQLVMAVNDLMESRIDANLKIAPDVLFCAKVSNVLLVNLPEEQELVTLEEFVEMQDTSFAVPVDPAGIWAYDFVVERHVRATTDFLAAKNVEIENAVNDMLGMIVGFELEDHVQPVTESHCGCSPEGFIAVDCLALRLPRDRCEIIKVKAHYNWSMCEGKSPPPAFFEVDLQLDGVSVRMDPSVEEIQAAINGGAVAVLKSPGFEPVTIPKNVQLILDAPLAMQNLPPVQGTGSQGTFYDRIAQDIFRCNNYLTTFSEYEWTWREDIDKSPKWYGTLMKGTLKGKYAEFKATDPSLDDFESKLKEFAAMENKVEISALMLKTGSLAQDLKDRADKWKTVFAKELHKDAFAKLEAVSEMVKSTSKKLKREEEQDTRSMLERSWKAAVSYLQEQRIHYKKDLIKTVNAFKKDVARFRAEYEKGIPPREAVERLKRVLAKSFKEEFEVRDRKQVPHQRYPALDTTRQELGYLSQLYDLYVAVLETIKDLPIVAAVLNYTTLTMLMMLLAWNTMLTIPVMVVVVVMIMALKMMIDNFAGRCKKMPKQLREWPAYNELKKEIEVDFQGVLPLLLELGKHGTKKYTGLISSW